MENWMKLGMYTFKHQKNDMSCWNLKRTLSLISWCGTLQSSQVVCNFLSQVSLPETDMSLEHTQPERDQLTFWESFLNFIVLLSPMSKQPQSRRRGQKHSRLVPAPKHQICKTTPRVGRRDWTYQNKQLCLSRNSTLRKLFYWVPKLTLHQL